METVEPAPSTAAPLASGTRAAGAGRLDAISLTNRASAALSARTETQSSDGHAGTLPSLLRYPGVGFSPTMLLQPAGTRPDPAVSVPRAKLTRPEATATAEPELEPPEMRSRSNTLRQAPYGLRSPAMPEANWSILVFPTRMPPSPRKYLTTGPSPSPPYFNPTPPPLLQLLPPPKLPL